MRKQAQELSRNGSPDSEREARTLTEKAALALEASLVVRHSSDAVASAFVSSRIAGNYGRTFGTLPANVDTGAILTGFFENFPA